MITNAPVLPHIASVLRAGLIEAAQTGVFVGRATPLDRPAKGVTLAMRGGRQRNVIQQRVVISATAWAATDDDADVLAAITVASILRAANDDPANPVSHIECLTTPTDMSDDSGVPMRFMQFATWFRSTV